MKLNTFGLSSIVACTMFYAANKGEGAGASPAAESKKREYILKETAWDEEKGEEFGGQADVLEINVGEVAGPFEYTGHSTITTENGDAVSHTATMDDGTPVRLPLSTIFVRALDQGNVQRGDIFLIKRLEDSVKKNGKGKGGKMMGFAIKVTKRVASGK